MGRSRLAPCLRTSAGARLIVTRRCGSVNPACRNAERMRHFLALHGPEVTVDLLRRGGRKVGELLVEKTAEREGAILVMGAYSHLRWRERIFGGVTEHVLGDTAVPVLMAH